MCSASEPALRARRILIVEDESLIGMTLSDLLDEAGFVVTGLVSSHEAALTHLDRDKPDAVVLDLTLRDGFCAGFAQELLARGVPFLIFSGHPPESLPLPASANVPWIEKPGREGQIVAMLQRITGAP